MSINIFLLTEQDKINGKNVDDLELHSWLSPRPWEHPFMHGWRRGARSCSDHHGSLSNWLSIYIVTRSTQMPQECISRFHCVEQGRGSSPSGMAVACNVDRRTQTETREPEATSTVTLPESGTDRDCSISELRLLYWTPLQRSSRSKWWEPGFEAKTCMAVRSESSPPPPPPFFVHLHTCTWLPLGMTETEVDQATQLIHESNQTIWCRGTWLALIDWCFFGNPTG